MHAEPPSQERPANSSGRRDIKGIWSGLKIPGFGKGTAADIQMFDPGEDPLAILTHF